MVQTKNNVYKPLYKTCIKQTHTHTHTHTYRHWQTHNQNGNTGPPRRAWHCHTHNQNGNTDHTSICARYLLPMIFKTQKQSETSTPLVFKALTDRFNLPWHKNTKPLFHKLTKTWPWGTKSPRTVLLYVCVPIADGICNIETTRNQHSGCFSGFGRSIQSAMQQEQCRLLHKLAKTWPWGTKYPNPALPWPRVPVAEDICNVETTRNQHSGRFSGFGRSIQSAMTQWKHEYQQCIKK